MRIGIAASLLALFASVHQPLVSQVTVWGVTSSNLNLRSGASIDNNLLALIPANTRISLHGCADGWCSTTFDGRAGYVASRYIRINDIIRDSLPDEPPWSNVDSMRRSLLLDSLNAFRQARDSLKRENQSLQNARFRDSLDAQREFQVGRDGIRMKGVPPRQFYIAGTMFSILAFAGFWFLRRTAEESTKQKKPFPINTLLVLAPAFIALLYMSFLFGSRVTREVANQALPHVVPEFTRHIKAPETTLANQPLTAATSIPDTTPTNAPALTPKTVHVSVFSSAMMWTLIIGGLVTVNLGLILLWLRSRLMMLRYRHRLISK